MPQTWPQYPSARRPYYGSSSRQLEREYERRRPSRANRDRIPRPSQRWNPGSRPGSPYGSLRDYEGQYELEELYRQRQGDSIRHGSRLPQGGIIEEEIITRREVDLDPVPDRQIEELDDETIRTDSRSARHEPRRAEVEVSMNYGALLDEN